MRSSHVTAFSMSTTHYMPSSELWNQKTSSGIRKRWVINEWYESIEIGPPGQENRETVKSDPGHFTVVWNRTPAISHNSEMCEIGPRRFHTFHTFHCPFHTFHNCVKWPGGCEIGPPGSDFTHFTHFTAHFTHFTVVWNRRGLNSQPLPPGKQWNVWNVWNVWNGFAFSLF